MTIILPALAVAFAALVVWLVVRIVNRRERWAKWTLTAVVGVPVLYVASFGPVCWVTSRINGGAGTTSFVYRPITHYLTLDRGFGTGDLNIFLSTGFLSKFASLFAAEGWNWELRESSQTPDAHWEWRCPKP